MSVFASVFHNLLNRDAQGQVGGIEEEPVMRELTPDDAMLSLALLNEGIIADDPTLVEQATAPFKQKQL